MPYRTRIKRLVRIALLGVLAVIPYSVFAEQKGWMDAYLEAADFVKKQEMPAAALAYYRAQLASSWARKMRPSAFVNNGNDPGTMRGAMNVTLGEAINPWAFQDRTGRLLPILDKLSQEISEIQDQEQLAASPYSGFVGGGEDEEKQGMTKRYPFVIFPKDRLQKFKIFAEAWLQKGRIANEAQ